MKGILFALLVLFAPTFSMANEPLKVVFFESYAPLSWQDQGKMRGILIDILDETLGRRLNADLQYEGYPWERAQLRVRQELADAFVTVPTKKRLEYTSCSRVPALKLDIGLYTYKDNPKMEALRQVKSYDDLNGYSLIEYVGNGWAKEKFKHLKINWAPTLELTYLMLAEKRADLLVRHSFNFDFHSKNLHIEDKIVKLPAVLNSLYFHLCIRKTSPYIGLLTKFDTVMFNLQAKGGLEKIFSRYRN